MSRPRVKRNEDPSNTKINILPFLKFIFTVFVVSQIASCDTVSETRHRELEGEVKKLADSLAWCTNDTAALKESLERSRDEVAGLRKKILLLEKQMTTQNVRPTTRPQRGRDATAELH